ncbi:GSCOCG00011997001-RA-CDS [Cotesia congregata]|uniref:ZSWIM3 N-terminal domain-containing protein n=1 Tax=Cotesia congregata TaxID=51543 RepID=A0A8J2HIZ1_COTCN|nr:GSCOCG00011997001-RA-CDS [Cotesia congregata]CAG5102946.1 Protein of unknown function [Cotesia congregata]
MANLFFINQEFLKSEDFDNLVERYQNESHYTFGRYDSRTMQTYCQNNGRNVDDYPNWSHYYYYMRCSRSGNYVPRKKCGVHSRDVESKRIECPVKLHVSADLERKVLVVTEWISNHNHKPENSNDHLKVSEILKRIKSNIAFDENTARQKKKMLINLLESFKKIDENEQISSDVESTHSSITPQTNNSPLHLDLPATPSHPPVNVKSSASMEKLPQKSKPVLNSPPNLVLRYRSEEKNLQPSILLERINVQTSTCGRPKRQRKRALGSDFYTYGTAKLKKKI